MSKSLITTNSPERGYLKPYGGFIASQHDISKLKSNGKRKRGPNHQKPRRKKK